MQFNVNLPRRIANIFKKKAKEVFPKEFYALLLGEIAKNGDVSVHEMYIPVDASKFSNEKEVTIVDGWFDDAQKLAKSKGLVLVGDIHSHCFTGEESRDPLHAPSEADWGCAKFINDTFSKSYCCFAVCRVRQYREKLRASIKFWPVTLKINTKITKEDEDEE